MNKFIFICAVLFFIIGQTNAQISEATYNYFHGEITSGSWTGDTDGYALPSHGQIHVLIVFAQFSDDNYDIYNSDWQKGSAPANMNSWIDQTWSSSATAYSLTDYFNQMSLNALKITGKAVSVTAPHTRQWYLDNSKERAFIHKEVIQSLESSEDFSLYDNWKRNSFYDHSNTPDNKVDFIFMIWRNMVDDLPEEDRSDIMGDLNMGWYGSLGVGTSNNFTVDGKTVVMNDYGSGITLPSYFYKDPFRFAIHEFAHYLLGGNQYHNGHGFWAMLSGYEVRDYMVNSYERMRLGWGNVIQVENTDPSLTNVTLGDFLTTGDAYCVEIDDATNQYFFIENHQQISRWDRCSRFSTEKGIFVIRQDAASDYTGAKWMYMIPSGGRYEWEVNQMTDNPYGESPDSLPVFNRKNLNMVEGYHEIERIPYIYNGVNYPADEILFIEDENGNPIEYPARIGYGNDVFNMSTKTKFNPWTNPNNQDKNHNATSIGFKINSISGGICNLDIYTDYDEFYVTEDITIQSGDIWNIEEGSEYEFASAKSLKVNGTLNAEGTSSQPVTFDRSGTSGQWGGIQFNSGSSGSIKYANVNNASPGVAVYSSNDIIIENCSFTDCFNSVLAVSGTAYLYKNIISGSYYSGIKALTSSDLTLAQKTILGSGKNQIKDGRTGLYSGPALYAGGSSCILAGDELFGNGGYNSITNYPSFVTSDNSWVDACYNWWGSYPPSSSGFLEYNGGTINYEPALSSAPSLSKLSAQSQTSSNEKLSKALVLKSKGDYNNAVLLFEQLLEENSSNDLTRFIIVHLGGCVNKLNGDFSSYARNKKIDSKYEALFTELTADKKANEGEIETAIKMYEEIISGKPEAEVEKAVLFKAGNLYESFKNDKAAAEKYYDELIEKYPEDELAKIIYLRRGIKIESESEFTNEREEQSNSDESKSVYKFGLEESYPNPFNPTTKIKFSISETCNVTLKVYNTLGEEVKVLVNEMLQPGKYEKIFDAGNLASGVYIYKITAGKYREVKKMLLLR
ncbi:MAG: T9SS type A sorting domain-containing protein [Ignavibacteria bacterium]|jgi:tetratricopeptide (TPR) repeat protein